MLIDAHNHLQDSRFAKSADDLVTEMKQAGIAGCVVNGTETADWVSVAKLAQRHSGFVLPSFGLHPWKVADRKSDWLESLRDFLHRYPNAGVGEIGLDRWIENHDIEDQLVVFCDQLNLAVELDRPCTIHCLRAWGQLLKELSRRDKLPRFLVHSFGGSIETGKKLADLGAYFSFSGYFLHARKQKSVEVFRQLPKDRILVETDAPDMLPPKTDRPFGGDEVNHPANLVRTCERLSELTEVKPEQFRSNTLQWWTGKATPC